MKGNIEYVGTLDGYDEFVNMVLSDAVEMYVPYSSTFALLARALCNNRLTTTHFCLHYFFATARTPARPAR